jgi:hypothetical protein
MNYRGLTAIFEEYVTIKVLGKIEHKENVAVVVYIDVPESLDINVCY